MPADLAPLITAFVTLFVIIDPLGLAPLFVALTRGETAARRRTIALTACLVAAGVLTLFGIFGDTVLAFAGISMPAFRVAGGALLFLTALDMLFEKRTKRREDQGEAADHENDPSVFPLAIPLIAGPGAIATMILLAGQGDGDLAWTVSVHLVMAGVLAVTFLLFLGAGVLERVLGPLGINVITRLLGMLLAALSVQFILDGLANFGVFTPAAL
ncbi:MAG: MarC family protein [Pseudomonadota bacterium]